MGVVVSDSRRRLAGNGQAFYRLETSDSSSVSRADGMTVDSQGYLYVATDSGLQVCDQPGRVVAIIAKPSRVRFRTQYLRGPGSAPSTRRRGIRFSGARCAERGCCHGSRYSRRCRGFRSPPTRRAAETSLAPRYSDMHGRSAPAIAVSDCRSIAIDRVHRLGGSFLVSLIDSAPGPPQSPLRPRARRPWHFRSRQAAIRE